MMQFFGLVNSNGRSMSWSEFRRTPLWVIGGMFGLHIIEAEPSEEDAAALAAFQEAKANMPSRDR